jgi:cysteine synthase A
MRVLGSAAEAIGATPIVSLARLVAATPGVAPGSRIVALCDHLNPGFSKKDRIARQIIEDAVEAGALTPGSGQTVVELTSGNTGTGLAIVCATMGLRFVAVMSRGNSEERARMMRALGAEVVLVDQAGPGPPRPGQVSGADLALVEIEAQRLVDERGAFRADQFALASNFRAHLLGTGRELWDATRGRGERLDAFVDFVGSGGTFAGVAQCFADRASERAGTVDAARAGTADGHPSERAGSQGPVRCFVVEPASAAALRGRFERGPDVGDADCTCSGAGSHAGSDAEAGAHVVQGGGYSMPELAMLDLLDPSAPARIDGFLSVTDDEVRSVARRLAREEGIFGGFSAGANVAAALQLLRSPWARSLDGPTVAAVVCDSGLKYLSTDLWEP